MAERLAQRIVIASGNRGKLREFASLLQPYGYALASQADFNLPEVAETGLTFVENALIKARHACRHTRLPCIADDSGLEVDALDGAPGLYSARFAGDGASDAANCRELLRRMAAFPAHRRGACFRCLLVLMRRPDDPAPLLCQGSWRGRIAMQPRGDNGFGYDSLFLPQGCEQTVAELPPAEKNRRSHRALALQQLQRTLAQEPVFGTDDADDAAGRRLPAAPGSTQAGR